MNIYKYIPITVLLTIVLFINFNDKGNYIWWLIYYSQFYLIVFGFIYIGFILYKNILVRSVLCSLGFYYLFELSMDVLRIFNSELWETIYEPRTINYILSIGLAFGLIVLPLYNIILKYLKTLFKK